MKSKFRYNLAGGIVIALILASGTPTLARTKKLNTIARDPYVGAMVIDADSGQILAADNPDAKAYPASVLMMSTVSSWVCTGESRRPCSTNWENQVAW